MKTKVKNVLFALFVAVSISAIGQNNPFEKFGYTPGILTLSNGEFEEFFDSDSIVQIGSALYNTKSQYVIGFIEKDTIYSETTLEPEIVSRWLSPDPLANMFPAESPYIFAGNSPILNVDVNGRFKLPTGQEGENFVKQYPTLAKYIQATPMDYIYGKKGVITELLRSEKIVKSLILNSIHYGGNPMELKGLNKSDLIMNFLGGNGPTIGVSNDLDGPEGTYTSYFDSHGNIFISARALNELENSTNDEDRQAGLTAVVSSLLHEFIETQGVGDNTESVNGVTERQGAKIMEKQIWGLDLFGKEEGKEAIKIAKENKDESVIPNLPETKNKK